MAPAVRAAAAELAAAIDAIAARMERGGRLVYVGAGTFRPARGRGRCRVLPHLRPRRRSRRRAAGRRRGRRGRRGGGCRGRRARRRRRRRRRRRPLCERRDAVRPRRASRTAAAAGALTVAVGVHATAPSSARLADHEVVAMTGAEVLAGSTRMKAGTAQKLVLNTISTVTMIRLGRTYGNLMVDVVATNAKLRARARRTVALATERLRRRRSTRRSLPRSGDAKVAIVSLLSGLDADDARRAARGRGRSDPARAGGRMRLGVEAAVVDGVLLQGDVEIADGKIAAVGARRRRQRDRDPRPRRPPGERIRRRRLRRCGRGRLPASRRGAARVRGDRLPADADHRARGRARGRARRDPGRAGRPAHHRRAPRGPVPLAGPARRAPALGAPRSGSRAARAPARGGSRSPR